MILSLTLLGISAILSRSAFQSIKDVPVEKMKPVMKAIGYFFLIIMILSLFKLITELSVIYYNVYKC